MRGEASPRCLSVDAHMKAVVVVVSQEIGQRACPGQGAPIRSDVGPLLQARADEAPGLAVGLRTVRARPAMPDLGRGEEGRELVAPIAAAVVGEDPFDPDPLSLKPALGQPQEGRTARRGLIREEGRIRQPCVIVDGDVQILPADPAREAVALPVDSMPDPADLPEFLDVEVHQLAGASPLVADHRGARDEAPGPAPSGAGPSRPSGAAGPDRAQSGARSSPRGDAGQFAGANAVAGRSASAAGNWSDSRDRPPPLESGATSGAPPSY